MTWSQDDSKAGGDLFLIQTSLLLLFCCVNYIVLVQTSWHLKWEKQRGLCQSKVASSPTCSQRSGTCLQLSTNCKIAYCVFFLFSIYSRAPACWGGTPHTLENLVTHPSKRFWLSHDCPYKLSQATHLKK